MKTEVNTYKARELTIGFFGWFLIWSLGYWVKDFLDIGQVTVRNGVVSGYPDLFGYWEYGFPVLTAIVIGILFFKKRNWFAYGIVATVISNVLVFIIIFSLFGASIGELLSDWNIVISFLSTPFFMVGGFY